MTETRWSWGQAGKAEEDLAELERLAAKLSAALADLLAGDTADSAHSDRINNNSDKPPIVPPRFDHRHLM